MFRAIYEAVGNYTVEHDICIYINHYIYSHHLEALRILIILKIRSPVIKENIVF
jgi:hypothetical protein